jgi:hypothetical protein
MMPEPTLSPMMMGRDYRTVIMPERSILIRMNADAAVLWVIEMNTLPHRRPAIGFLVHAETRSLSRRPLNIFRCSIKKYRPTKNRPKPARSDAII